MGALDGLLEYGTLAVSVGLLIFGVSVLLIVRVRGGLDLALAHLVADPARRRIFLGGLFTSLAALFALGLAVSLEALFAVSFAVALGTEATLFVVGAIGILVLMADAVRLQPLSLQEKWNLQETAARGTLMPDPVPVGPGWTGREPADPPAKAR